MDNKHKARVLYDFIEVTGGAERFSIELANSIHAELLVAGVSPKALEDLPKPQNTLKSISTLSSLPIWKSLKSMHAFSHISETALSSNLNIYSGNNALLAIERAADSARNYYYCHTPPRFVYDLYDHYQTSLPWYQAQVVKWFASYVKAKYEPALRAMDRVNCNSKNVQKRLRDFLGIEAKVLYPPTRTTEFYNEESQGYYLSTARIEDYKRIELIVEAFIKRPDLKLLIASGGSQMRHLQEKSKEAENIVWLGWLSDEQLKKYIAQCIATIYVPKDEDFGMSPVESMAAGKPVIGVAEGGLLETVQHQQTGWLMPAKPSVENLISSLDWLTPRKAMRLKPHCEERAKAFGLEVFHQNLLEEGWMS